MHIASVLGYLSPRYGGPPNVAINLGRALEKIGVHGTCWATATDSEQKELARIGETSFLFRAQVPRSWHRSNQLRRKLTEKIGDIDILHLHQIWDYPIYAAAQVARRHGKPYLVTPHGIFTQAWRYNSFKKRAYLKIIAMPFLNEAACIHAVTPAEVKGFESLGIRTSYTIIPNGVAVEEFTNLPSHEEAEHIWPELFGRVVVLFLGRVSPEKGLDQLITSWQLVIKKCPHAFLMIAGPDFKDHTASLDLLITKLGLGRSIIMPGLLWGDQKKIALSRADIYVQPSYSEGFSGSILEALSCGKPCVITQGCNFPEVAENMAGDVVEPNAESLSSAIIRLLSLTHHERQKMGERGRDLVRQNYTWDISARKILTLYNCILEKRPIPLYPEPANIL